MRLGKAQADCKSREGANSPENWDHYSKEEDEIKIENNYRECQETLCDSEMR